jgi:hypothetical protein
MAGFKEGDIVQASNPHLGEKKASVHERKQPPLSGKQSIPSTATQFTSIHVHTTTTTSITEVHASVHQEGQKSEAVQSPETNRISESDDSDMKPFHSPPSHSTDATSLEPLSHSSTLSASYPHPVQTSDHEQDPSRCVVLHPLPLCGGSVSSHPPPDTNIEVTAIPSTPSDDGNTQTVDKPNQGQQGTQTVDKPTQDQQESEDSPDQQKTAPMRLVILMIHSCMCMYYIHTLFSKPNKEATDKEGERETPTHPDTVTCRNVKSTYKKTNK